jgi:hypothetical protein
MNTGDRFLTPRQRALKLAEQQRLDRLASPTPVPERITAALDIRGLYGPEVDRACGVEEPAVDLWEAGDLVPTAEQVEALARLTDFPVRFFYLPAPPKIGPVFICSDDGCEVIDNRPDAPVVPMTGRGRLL